MPKCSYREHFLAGLVRTTNNQTVMTWFSDILIQYKERNGLETHREIAEAIGEERINVTRWLGGAMPRPEDQEKILKKLGINIRSKLGIREIGKTYVMNDTKSEPTPKPTHIPTADGTATQSPDRDLPRPKGTSFIVTSYKHAERTLLCRAIEDPGFTLTDLSPVLCRIGNSERLTPGRIQHIVDDDQSLIRIAILPLFDEGLVQSHNPDEVKPTHIIVGIIQAI